MIFCLKTSRDVACFVSSGNEFQSFGPRHLKFSFQKEIMLIFGTLQEDFLDILTLLLASKMTFVVALVL